MKSQFEFESHGDALIKGYHWYQLNEQPRAVVVLSHGMAEHILRYEDFAEFLVSNGVFVYGHSHRGHFETAGHVDKLGYLGEGGWKKMVEDLNQVVQKSKSSYPEAKVWLFGHSMGSYVGRDYLLTYADELDGVILSGTGYPTKVELLAGALIAKIESKIKGDKPSKLLDKMSFGAFNKAFKPTKTDFDWLSRDEKKVEEYINSEWCGQLHPSSFFYDMADNMIKILYNETLTLSHPKPILVMSGGKDPVGQFGKGVKKTADYYKNKGFEVQMSLYEDGRHEMLNELNRHEVYTDVLEFIVKNIN